MEESRKQERNGHAAAGPNGSRTVETVNDRRSEDGYALALEAVERLFLDQQVQINREMETARTAAEKSDFQDYRSISSAARRAAQLSWQADDQIAGLKKRLDELYQERVVEPIMNIRRLSSKMEERNRNLFCRRVGDRR